MITQKSTQKSNLQKRNSVSTCNGVSTESDWPTFEEGGQ